MAKKSQTYSISMSHSNAVQGTYYDGHNSSRHSGVISIDDSGLVTIEGVSCPDYPFDQLTFSPRIGNASRTIYFPDGTFFESRDNETIDALINKHTTSNHSSLLHSLESKLRYIVLSAVVISVSVLAFLQYGIPAVSKHIAFSLSPDVSAQLADTSLEQLDEFYFSRTELTKERREIIHQLFLTSVPQGEASNFTYQLHFRKGDKIGPNAFALPNGSVIITDELIELAEDDLEILSIFYHEIGHVHYRHSLRQIIQSAGALGISVWLTGNIESLFDWTATVPAFLIQRKYSRDMETEADDYSLEKMLEHNIDPMHFVHIMTRMQSYIYKSEESTENDSDTAKADTEVTGTDDDSEQDVESNNKTAGRLLNLLSSHPNTDERMEKFRRAAEKVSPESH
ncbi:M48 family metallopeptidase [Pseudomaricurvus sp.]|uniref:M48 family metallopeptidase n=1 Tax=Pseudomaricurvus sp. TaxID=2004510 RepID=UPI003F6D6877